jgi:hypothetical protein
MDIKILVDGHLPLLVSLVVMLLAGIGCYSVIAVYQEFVYTFVSGVRLHFVSGVRLHFVSGDSD